jgi:pilus assembly protein CpaF
MSLISRIEKGRRPRVPARSLLVDLKHRVLKRLVQYLEEDGIKVGVLSKMPDYYRCDFRTRINELFDTILAEEGIVLARTERRRLFDQVVSELLGLGPLEPLLGDSSITRIMTVNHHTVFIERGGLIQQTNVSFESPEHLAHIANLMIAGTGEGLEKAQVAEGRLPDGSHFHIVMPPLATDGIALTITRPSSLPTSVKQVLEQRIATIEVMGFLQAAIRAGLNVMVVGSRGSGIIDMLNILTGLIPGDRPALSIEANENVDPQAEHVVRFRLHADQSVSVSRALGQALKLKPSYLILDEINEEAAWDVLQVMNLSDVGVLSAMFAEDPEEALNRLETMVWSAHPELPPGIIRQRIASGLDVIVHQDRMGRPHISQVVEIAGVTDGQVEPIMLFRYLHGQEPTIEATGTVPACLERIRAAGIELPPQVFETPIQRYVRTGKQAGGRKRLQAWWLWWWHRRRERKRLSVSYMADLMDYVQRHRQLIEERNALEPYRFLRHWILTRRIRRLG